MTTRDFKHIVVAGGCFWGVEEYYHRLKGIIDTQVGYANGNGDSVTYREVCSGTTGHVEAVMLTYNHTVISLDKILEHLFRMIDPTTRNRQANDIGTQYRTGIYYTNDQDKDTINQYIDSIKANYKDTIVTEVLPLENFVVAEPEHQMYLEGNPGGYCHIDFSVIQPNELKEEYLR